MSARTILAVRTGRNKFKGVFHEQSGEPWVLGDHILSRVIRARGDLQKVVEEIILEVPWGWVSLPRAHKSDLKKKPNRRLFSQNILRKIDEIEMDWVYLFDLDDRDACVGDGARPKRQSERDAGDPLAASTLRATTGAARASSGDPSSTIKKWTWSRITAGNVFQRRTLCSKWCTSQ